MYKDTRRILLIDRDALRRAGLSTALTRHHFDVTEFDSGREALRHLLFESVHAVLLDYSSSLEPRNPLSSGKRMVQEITRVDAFVPLIVICDRCDSLDHETVAAADLVLRRPLSDRQIIDGVETVLGETLRERAQRKSGYIFAFR